MSGYKKLCQEKAITKPIICVPTTYNQVTDHELFSQDFNIVIYANHPLRAAYRAMQTTCRSILTHGRSFEASSQLGAIDEIMELVGYSEIKTKDNFYKKDIYYDDISSS